MSSAAKTLQAPACPQPRSGIVSDSLASGLVFALCMTVAQRLLGAVRGVLFCRLMTDQELGQWSMIYSVLMLMAPLAVLGLPGSFGKFVEHYSHSGQLRSFLRQVGMVSCGGTLLLALTILVAPDFFSFQILGESGHTALMYWTAACLVLLTLANYLTSLVEAMRQIRLATMIRFVSGTSFTLLGIVLLLTPVNSAISAVASFALASLLGALPALWFLRRQRGYMATMDHPLSARVLWVRLAPYAAWWWVSNILHNCFELIDRYMLVHLGRMSAFEVQGALGQYHSSRVVPLLMVGVAAMLSGLLLPYVSAAWQAGDLRRARQQMNLTIKLSSLGMLVANVMLLALAPLLFDSVLQGKYNEGLALLPLTMVYCTWFSMLVVSQDYLWVSEKGKYAVACMAVGLAGNVALNGLLIPPFGLWGAVVATTAGNLLAVMAMFIANSRLGCPPDFGCWTGLAFPLVLLLDPWAMTGAALVVCLGCLAGRQYFSAAEQSQLREIAERRMGRRPHRHE